MATQTPNFGFDLPVVGADSDAWGGFLNGNWSDLDTILATFVPESGGTFSGSVTYTLPVIAAAIPTLDTHLTNKLYVDTEVGAVAGDLTTHEGDTANPHVVTAAQVSAVSLGGDTMTGQLELPGGGTGDEAVTADELAVKAPLADPTFTGTVDLDILDMAGEVLLGVEVIASGAAIALSMAGASKKTIALATNTTITVADEIANQTVEVWITQTGSNKLATWVGVDKWFGGDAPVIGSSSGDVDIIVLVSDGTIVIGQHIGTAS